MHITEIAVAPQSKSKIAKGKLLNLFQKIEFLINLSFVLAFVDGPLPKKFSDELSWGIQVNLMKR